MLPVTVYIWSFTKIGQLVSVIFTPVREIQGTEWTLKTRYSRSSLTKFVWTRKNIQWGGEPLLIPFHWFRRISGAVAKSVRRLRKFRSDMWSRLCRANDSWQSNSHSTTGAGSVSHGFSNTSSCRANATLKYGPSWRERKSEAERPAAKDRPAPPSGGAIPTDNTACPTLQPRSLHTQPS